jgi:hypothetical protein
MQRIPNSPNSSAVRPAHMTEAAVYPAAAVKIQYAKYCGQQREERGCQHAIRFFVQCTLRYRRSALVCRVFR